MAEKRKNMSREEMAAFIQQQIETQQAEDRQEVEDFVQAIVQKLGTGKFDVRWDGGLVINVRRRSGWPKMDLLKEALDELGYEYVDMDEFLHYWWTVYLRLKSEDGEKGND
jgi:hypothetical protein